MQKIITLLLIAVLLTASRPVYAPSDYGETLEGGELITTGSVFCLPSTPRQVEWTNITGQNVYIYQTQIEMFAQKGAVVDFSATFFKRNPAGEFTTLINFFGWDRYAESTGPAVQTLQTNFTPNYFLIPPDWGITLVYQCSRFAPGLANPGVLVNFIAYYSLHP